MVITLLLLAIAIVSYLLGSINGSIITSRFVFGMDVRSSGSGNAGLTNFYRTFGWKGAAMVIAIDVLKGVLAALIGGWLLGIVENSVIGRVFATFCLILGHIYPVFYGFKGGKGVLTGISAAFVISPGAATFCILVFLVIVAATRYVSFGSVMGAAAFPVAMLIMDFTGLPVLLSLFCSLAIIIHHIPNIMRLIAGTESRLVLKRDLTHKLDDFNKRER